MFYFDDIKNLSEQIVIFLPPYGKQIKIIFGLNDVILISNKIFPYCFGVPIHDTIEQ